METVIRNMKGFYCRCGSKMLYDAEKDEYYCIFCGCRLTRAEMKRLEEAFEKDAKAFI